MSKAPKTVEVSCVVPEQKSSWLERFGFPRNCRICRLIQRHCVDEMSCFKGDINFCPECGNILPIPGVHDFITCPRCSFNIPVQEISGHSIKSSVVFNPLEKSLSAVESEEDGELKGPVIDRRCSRCNKEGMIYHTRQMRSADEGQTVFFTCMHCRYQEKEDS